VKWGKEGKRRLGGPFVSYAVEVGNFLRIKRGKRSTGENNQDTLATTPTVQTSEGARGCKKKSLCGARDFRVRS